MDDAFAFWNKLESSWQVAIVAVGVIVVICLLSMLARPAPYNSNLKELVRQSAQLHEIARQDKDPAIALQHASEALAILSVARHLAADSAIEKASGTRVGELASAIASLQASCIAALSPRDPTTVALAAGYASL